MEEKINVTVYLDKEIVEESKLSVLNLSRIMENTLSQTLRTGQVPSVSTWSGINNVVNGIDSKPAYLAENTLFIGGRGGIRTPVTGSGGLRPILARHW